MTGQAHHFVEVDTPTPIRQDHVDALIHRAFAERKNLKSAKRFYTRTVCPSCNNGWMRRLDEAAFWFIEAAAKSFHGVHHMPLDINNAPTLAKWVFMKTICSFSRDGDKVLPHHAQALFDGYMPDDIRVELLHSRIYGYHPFAFRAAFAPTGAWIATFRVCDYYLRVFYDPIGEPRRLVRCIQKGRVFHPFDDYSVGFVPEDPLGRVRDPRTVPEEMELLSYLLFESTEQ